MLTVASFAVSFSKQRHMNLWIQAWVTHRERLTSWGPNLLMAPKPITLHIHM